MAVCFVAFALLRILRFRHNSHHGGTLLSSLSGTGVDLYGTYILD